MSTADIQWAAEDDFLDYFLIVGSIKEVLATYTDLTGKSRLPPKWSFGYWQSKISYGSAAETLEIGRKLREHRIPCDVIHLDTDWFERDWFCDLTFDPHGFPDPQEYLRQMEKMGYKISLWQLPYIPEGSKLFDDLKAVDGFVKTREGEIYDVKVCYVKGFQGRVGLVDYTNPNARRVHMDYVRQLFRMGGIRVFKTDFGEAAPVDGVYFDGTPGHRMHNLYPLLYNQAFFETTQEETGDAIVWARSAWAGGQRHPVHWGGDNTPNYANLAPQLAGGLSLGLSGFPFWSQDIGGFLGDTSADLLVRWMQLGVFLSHTRIHGFGDRELYKFPDHVLRICRDYLQLRYRLMPYIYGAARDCVARSLPMARAMVVDYQDDPTTYGLADQYMFGDSLLVAPILTESKRRRVYLPRGRWTDWWTLEPIDGGQWIEVEAQLEKLPLFVREGGVIPMGPAMNYVDEVETDRIKLRLSPFTMDGKSEFSVPIKDDWIPIHYLAEAGRHTLTIGRCETTFEVDTLGHSADIQHNLAQ